VVSPADGQSAVEESAQRGVPKGMEADAAAIRPLVSRRGNTFSATSMGGKNRRTVRIWILSLTGWLGRG
jgi:hypothetical protein